jgi:hypothetical protein
MRSHCKSRPLHKGIHQGDLPEIGGIPQASKVILGKAPHPGNFSVCNWWTSPERVVPADRCRKALEMRTRGATRAPLSRRDSSAHQWVLLELKNIPLAAAEEVFEKNGAWPAGSAEGGSLAKSGIRGYSRPPIPSWQLCIGERAI